MIAQQVAQYDWSWLKNSSVVVAAIGLIAIILTAWINAMLARRKQRRERYAAMAATLAAWIEVPYMIRRRTSNDREVIERLVAHVQALQHQLNVDHADLRAECRWLARCRDAAQRAVQQEVRPFIDDAWKMPPVASTSDLIVGDWGPTNCRSSLEAFVDALRWRFGWRRLLNLGRLGWNRLFAKKGRPRLDLPAAPASPGVPS